MQHLSACPICQGHDLKLYLSCQDHSVSHETFTLQKCGHCGFVMTNPRPMEYDLPRYYASETYISHSDRSTSLIDHIYRTSRRFTLKWKYNVVHTHSTTKPTNILDFGCGTGAFLSECQKNSMQISGVEPSSIAREIAIRTTKARIWENLSDIQGNYHVITLWHVLEHVPALHETLDKIKNHLKPNGTMFIAVPNLKSLDAKRYLEYWAGYDVPRHLWHFSKDTMKKTLESHDLNLVTTIPMRLDSYYVSLLSEKYKNGDKGPMNMAKAVLQGWQSNKQARKTSQYSSLIYIVRK
jgi:SAM-dependent methyltransferase